LHQHALAVLPGGNTRSVLHTYPFPICMDRGDRNKLIDVDGHEYLRPTPINFYSEDLTVSYPQVPRPYWRNDSWPLRSL
jgi:hypothetical protein